MMRCVLCVVALFSCLSLVLTKDLTRRFLLDNIHDLEEEAIRCCCGNDCKFGGFEKGICDKYVHSLDCNHDTCTDDACSGHGTCFAIRHQGRLCECTGGYTGKTCEQSRNQVTVDHCVQNPCKNGNCENQDNGYHCACDAGWDGTNCDSIAVDHCAHNPCKHGHCTNQLNGYDCRCTSGWIGTNCDTIAVDHCLTNPCTNGQCTNHVHGHQCTCNGGWSGTNCDIAPVTQAQSTVPLFTAAPDHCTNNPCGAHGQCTSTGHGHQCACVTGWSGKNCDIDVDLCSSSPCKNNGTCLDLGSIVSCICMDGWSGSRCEKDATPSCTHICVLEPVATVHSVFNNAAENCTDASKGSNEAIPMTCCGLGHETTWLKGIQVQSHCSGAVTIPQYTPIASFKSGRPVADTSGVFLNCDANGFKYIRQSCSDTPHVIVVDAVDASSFYVIY